MLKRKPKRNNEFTPYQRCKIIEERTRERWCTIGELAESIKTTKRQAYRIVDSLSLFLPMHNENGQWRIC